MRYIKAMLVTVVALTAIRCNDAPGEPPVPPAIGISGTTVAFSFTLGEAAPVSQSLSVSNEGGGTLAGLTATVRYPEGQATGWLIANLGSTSAPALLTLGMAIGSASPGLHSATVEIASPDAANTQTVNVTLAASAAPEIVLSATDVPLRLYDGSLDPVEQKLDVTSGGGILQGLNVEITYGEGQPLDWLSADLNQAAAPAELVLRARAGTLARGAYIATVIVRGANPLTVPRLVVVRLQVARDPATLVGTYQLAPVPLIRCTALSGLSLSAALDRITVVAATEERIDLSGLMQVSSPSFPPFSIPIHLSVPFGPRDRFAGETEPISFSQSYQNVTVSGKGTLAIDAGFETDEKFVARIDATLEATLRVVLPPPFPPITSDVTCSPLSFSVSATR